MQVPAQIAVAEAIDGLCPYAAVHEYSVEQDDDGAVVPSVQEEALPLLLQGLRLVFVNIVEEINP